MGGLGWIRQGSCLPHRRERERIARLYVDLLKKSSGTPLEQLSPVARIFALTLYERRASVPLSELAEVAGASPHAASRAAAALEEAGLVTIGPDPDDRRSKLVTPTPALRPTMDGMIEAVSDALARTGTWSVLRIKK
jgi:DNA-binding MarR family transcriptional regulator